MGGANSTELVQRSDNFDQRLQKWLQSPDDRFFVNIREPNFLQVVDAPRDILQHLLKSLGQSAKQVRPIWRPNTYEIELYDSPFSDEIRETNFDLIEISFCRFLSILHNLNWSQYASLNLSPFCDRSSCYFRKNHLLIHPADDSADMPESTVLSVSFSSPFTVLMTSNKDECLDDLCSLVRSSLSNVLQILRLDQRNDCGVLNSATKNCRILKTKYNLWKCVSLPDSVINRRFLLEIVSRLENIGYRLSTCIDFRGNADTLFFIKNGDHDPMTNGHLGEFCLLSANRWDLLRLYEAPKDLIDVTRLLLSQHWPQGVESESAYSNWHEFHLSAFPWAARAMDAAQSHSMIASILQTFLARGWKPVASVQLSRTFKDRSCVVLRKEKPAYRPHMCLGLLDSNELHLINAEDDLRDYVLDLVCSKTNVKRKLSKVTPRGAWPFLTLRGDPWCTISLANQQNHQQNQQNREIKLGDYDYLEARHFVQKLLTALRFRGWEVVIGVDLAARVKYKRKTSAGGSVSTNSKMSTTGVGLGEDSMPLDVNSLILANVNGSRHNSLARSANESLFLVRPQNSIE